MKKKKRFRSDFVALYNASAKLAINNYLKAFLRFKFFPESLNLFIGSVIFGHQGFVKYQFVTVGIFKV